jgi:hypothetical protein
MLETSDRQTAVQADKLIVGRRAKITFLPKRKAAAVPMRLSVLEPVAKT